MKARLCRACKKNLDFLENCCGEIPLKIPVKMIYATLSTKMMLEKKPREAMPVVTFSFKPYVHASQHLAGTQGFLVLYEMSARRT